MFAVLFMGVMLISPVGLACFTFLAGCIAACGSSLRVLCRSGSPPR
jgi:hypothetical protein